jgi:hypothetical protein
MTIKKTLVMFLILMTTAIGRSANGTIADLSVQLRDSLLRDASCKDAPEAGTARARLLESQVDVQEIHGGPGGLIASVQGSCACTGSTCSTYVYMKDGQSYRLGFKGEFTSLHPMKIYKRGMQSLTGRLQISDTQAETTVYDWNGQNYEASLCATVTQGRNQRLPSIARHECGKAH